MRLAPLLLILALAAWPANAQQTPLRGPVKPEQAQEPQQPATPLPGLLAPLAGPGGADAERCRLDCAGSYYVCLSTEAAEDCAPNWMQCRSGCAASARRRMITTGPDRS
ncbi:hypothetical protein [Phenylobacterium sp.]|uniref:hypothetical protein n=1 Tax=Phenylobacterium sp. TaxID=1871053 RepID=UPI002897A128|nr:hypothetical protein [Phenylobacterium sp.]